MSQLTIRDSQDPSTILFQDSDVEAVASRLKDVGIRFEQWQPRQAIQPGISPDEIIAAYQDDIDRLVAEEGYATVDVVSLDAGHPDKDVLRAKFWQEHTHSEDEVRFFVAGSGLFTLHLDDGIYEALCTAGDFISVPAGTKHWFDMGPEPSFACLRLFNDPSGWVADYTGAEIADAYSRLDA